MATLTAYQADAFVDAIGINVHAAASANDPSNSYGMDWVPLVHALGIRHVRDTYAAGGTGKTLQTTALNALADRGIGYLMSLNSAQVGDVGHNQIALDNFLANTGIPAPEAVEPMNEWDIYSPSGYAADIQTWQPTMYPAIKDKWPNAVVLGASLSNNTLANNVGSLGADLDANNLHLYYQRPAKKPEYVQFMSRDYLTANFAVQKSGGPVWVTETGMVSGASSDPAVETSELGAARLLMRTLMYLWAPASVTSIDSYPSPTGRGGVGAKRVYIYELLDEHAVVTEAVATEDRFGLYHADGTPKLVATGIGNLLGLLSDPGSTFTPDTLGVTATGGSIPAHMLFQKRDGSYWLAFWETFNAMTSPDGGGTPYFTGTDQPDSAFPTTFTFTRSFRNATLYRPIFGRAPIAFGTASNSITVDARRDIQLLKLSGRAKSGLLTRGLHPYFDAKLA